MEKLNASAFHVDFSAWSRREGKRDIYAWSITWLIGSKVVVGEKHASRLRSPSAEAKGIASHAA